MFFHIFDQIKVSNFCCLKNVFKEYDGPLQLILDSGEQWISFYIYQAKVGTGRDWLHFVIKRQLFTLKGWGGGLLSHYFDTIT